MEGRETIPTAQSRAEIPAAVLLLLAYATMAQQLPDPTNTAADEGDDDGLDEAELPEREELLEAMGQGGASSPPAAGGAGAGGGGGGAAADGATPEATALAAAARAALGTAAQTPVVPDHAKAVAHKFWDTQPMKKLSEKVIDEYGPIDDIKTPDQVRQEPYALPKGFEWVTMNVLDAAHVKEIYELLTENYVEDDDNMFRFDYSAPFLQWALTPPGYVQEWHVGVRQASNGRLLGFISGIPAEVQVYDACRKMSEINFLCVHRKLRSKRLAPVLIKEVTRRVNLLDQWQAVYTAGVLLPKPVAQCHYYHRSINPKKLVEIGFSRLGQWWRCWGGCCGVCG